MFLQLPQPAIRAIDSQTAFESCICTARTRTQSHIASTVPVSSRILSYRGQIFFRLHGPCGPWDDRASRFYLFLLGLDLEFVSFLVLTVACMNQDWEVQRGEPTPSFYSRNR
jgi:hypothetical protein